MAFGLEETGFTLKRLTDIIASLKIRAKAQFGEGITTDDDSVFGQLIAVLSDEFATLWEGMQEVYDSQKPDAAEGVQLDDVADLNGVTRLSATSSTVSAVLKGTPATVVPINSLASVNPTNVQFKLLAAVTLDTGNPVGILVTSAATDGTYTITINGVPFSHVATASTAIAIVAALKVLVDADTSSATPITFTDNSDGTFRLDATDQSVTFTLALTANLTPNTVSVPGNWSAVNTGPVEAPAATLTQIDTPVFGWDTVTNPGEATEGTNVETDTAFRIRRRQSVSIAGAGTVDAMTANLLDLTGVTNVFIVENRTFVVDSDGRPPKSFEAVVTGGTDLTIAQEIWNRKPAGIETHGDTTVATVTDSQGNTRSISFSRPTTLFMHLQIDYTLNSEEIFPTNGESGISTASVAEGNTLTIGEDVILQKLLGPIYDAVPGIATLVIRIASSATEGGAPGSFQATNFVISNTQTASFDISRVTVTKI